ncbi:MAG: GNAT family N-acetyltransferase [Deltaproteobacteria bacterium]|nr:GNAT family N-acetyltransferase [Deltaproteobacteria bacterium]
MPIIRAYQPGDEKGLIRLFATVFHQELSLAVWQWKYLRANEPPPMFVAEEDGEIVCHYGAIRQDLRWEGQSGVGWDSVDTMCHPRYQGRGLLRRTLAAFIQSYGEGQSLLIYGFPGERHRRLGERLLRYEPIVPVYKVRKEILRNPVPFPAGVVVLPKVPNEWDDHWRLLERRFGMIAKRDHGTLTWRYVRRPSKRYRLLSIPGIPALAVVGFESERAYFMEFLLEEGNTAAARVLLQAVESLCGAEGAETLEGWFPRFAWESGFLTGTGGFLGATADNYFECRLFEPGLRAAWLAEHFYYSLGDYDVF